MHRLVPMAGARARLVPIDRPLYPPQLQGYWVGNCDGINYMRDCQNYGPFLGPYYNTGPNTGPNLGDPKRDHNFDNPPYTQIYVHSCRRAGNDIGNCSTCGRLDEASISESV